MENWPYWVRGGIILSGVVILLLILITLLQSLFNISISIGLGNIIIFLVYSPLYILPLDLLGINSGWYTKPNMFGWFFIIAFWFIVGALISWIYEKIKSRKNTPLSNL